MVYLIINWVLSVLGLLGVTIFVPGFRVRDFASALIAAGLVGLASALIGFVLRRAGPIAQAISLALLGIFVTFLFRLSGLLIPGFAMNGFVPAISGAVALTLVNIATLRFAAIFGEDFGWDTEIPGPEPEPEGEPEQARTTFVSTKLVSSNR